MSCLYILEPKLLSVALLANIFSQSIGCLFILFMVSFTVQKLISLITCRALKCFLTQQRFCSCSFNKKAMRSADLEGVWC